MVHLLGQRLIFTRTAHGEILPFGNEGRCLIAICRNCKFLCYTLGKGSSELGTFLKSDTCNRDKRAHIGSSHTRMLAMMLTHVDQLGCPLDAAESSFHHCLRFSYESHNRAVGRRARIYIEEFDALYTLDCVGNTLYRVRIAALTEIGHTFYYPFFHSIL